MVNFALSSIIKGGKECTFHLLCFKCTASMLIRNDGFSLEEFSAKTVSEYLISGTSYESSKYGVRKIHIAVHPSQTSVLLYSTKMLINHSIQGGHVKSLIKEGTIFVSHGNRRKSKIQHCFHSQNTHFIFPFKKIPLFRT